jgi:hypothetical protein
MEVGGQRHATTALPPERPGTHFAGRWVGSRAGLDGCGKSRLHRNSLSGPSSYTDPRCCMTTDKYTNALFLCCML